MGEQSLTYILPKRTLTLFHESKQINFTLYGFVELKEF